MKTKAIKIIAHSSTEEAANVADTVTFQTEAELAQLSADWPTARLIEIWNSLPGVTR